MSVSFGIQTSGSKRKPTGPIAAFQNSVSESEPELSGEQKLTQSKRLQVAALIGRSGAVLRLYMLYQKSK